MIPDTIQSKTFLYADDTAIFYPFPKDEPHTSLNIQRDLNEIASWSFRWRMVFKSEKKC